MDKYKFPTELKLWKYELERLALQFGLELVPINYNMVSFVEMSEIAATGGFPVTVPHWGNGQQSIHLKKRYRYAMGKIMELVINTVPARAYLHMGNSTTTQKSVMAHVNGHVDLFVRNAYFAPTNRDMINTFQDDRALIERCMEEHGTEKIKTLYDFLLSFQTCIDANALYVRRTPPFQSDEERAEEERDRKIPKRISVPDGLPQSFDRWLNPPEWIEAQRERTREEEEARSNVEKGLVIPEYPTQDILEFLKQYAPLQDFERAIIDIVRRHAYYFAPQGRTKLLHEGWATLVEEWIMSQTGVMQDSEYFDFVRELNAVQRKPRGGMNPYRFGYELLMNIWYRWDTGRHGDIWERCDFVHIKDRWNEFIIFKNLFEESNGDITVFAKLWREFSAFQHALKSGKFVIPEKFFKRDLFTDDYLIPLWLRYQSAEHELEECEKHLRALKPLEKKVDDELKRLIEEHYEDDVLPSLLRMKARRDVYATYKKDDLYLWTTQELEMECAVLQKIVAFKKDFQNTEPAVDNLSIAPDWLEYARRFPGTIPLGKGKEKLFEVTASYDDLMLIDEFFTRDFCLRHKYFLYKAKPVWNWDLYPEHETEHYFFENRSFERIKKYLLFQYTNHGNPIIVVREGNHRNRRELLLEHHHNGVDLDWSNDGMHVIDVLERLFHIWGGRTVRLLTIRTEIPKEEPFWTSWHRNDQKDSADEPEMLTGTLIECSWGPHGKNEIGYQEKEMAKVTFKAPF